ncbi:hypothetical protein LCGC14_0610780 [marine sediment metagenome]|uniref:Uncharacterized protein n=1 Tax=marine sediment metagenome TaxID=412755 RepID=A0A0F9UGA0_9ZZZZ
MYFFFFKNISSSIKSKPKNILLLLIGSLVIYLFIVLATQIHFVYILKLVIYTLVVGVLMYLFWWYSHKYHIRERFSFSLILLNYILYLILSIFMV